MEKTIERYMNTVRRKLNLPRDVKNRVMADLESSVRSRSEAGQTDREIMEELGTPVQVAAELNEQMREFAYGKSPWRWLCLAMAVVSGLTLLFKGGMNLLTAMLTYAESQSIGIIGGADGPTAIFVTRPPESAIYGILMTALILAMSIVGFYYLGHMRKK